MEYKLCRHTHDDGRACGSAAAKARDYCSYHLGYRARQLRIAQYRARGERFDLKLPPLESMQSVQSALTQLGEAIAADMIDLKRADRLMRLLNMASRNLLKSDKWPAGIVHSDQPGPAVDLAAEYGLPSDLDVDTPPELAFPNLLSRAEPSAFGGAVEGPAFDLSSRAQAAASAAGVEGPAFSRSPLFPVIPPLKLRDYTAEAEAALLEVTPQDLELNDILKSHGYKAMERRAREHQRAAERKQLRKLFRANYEHYAAVAKTKNIERAAEKLLAQRQAAERAAAAAQPAVTQAAGEAGPVPPAVGGVGISVDIQKKPAASAAADAARKEVATA